MKRALSLLCALALLIPPIHALEEAQANPVTIEYNQLQQLVAAGNPIVTLVNQAYETQALELQRLEREHRNLMDRDVPLSAIFAASVAMQTEIQGLKVILSARDADQNRTILQQTYLAQQRYLSHYLYQAQLEQLQLELSQIESQLRRFERQYELGVIALVQLEEVQRQAKGYESLLLPMENARNQNLAALADSLGLTTQIVLAGLPDVPLDQIPQRDLQADRQAYLLGAPEVYLRLVEVEDAQRALTMTNQSNTAANKYALQTAQEGHQQAQAAASRDFPMIYDALLREYQLYATSTTVTDAQTAYQRTLRQFELGLVSRQTAESAQSALQQAELSRTLQKISLCQSFLTYQYHLTDWSMTAVEHAG